MSTTPNQTAAALRRIGAPEFLGARGARELAPGELRHEMQTPRIWYSASADDLDRLPFGGRLVALWETNGESLTAYLEGASPQVIRYYYEDPGTHYEVLGNSVWGAIEQVLGLATERDRCGCRAACGHADPKALVRRLETEPEG